MKGNVARGTSWPLGVDACPESVLRITPLGLGETGLNKTPNELLLVRNFSCVLNRPIKPVRRNALSYLRKDHGEGSSHFYTAATIPPSFYQVIIALATLFEILLFVDFVGDPIRKFEDSRSNGARILILGISAFLIYRVSSFHRHIFHTLFHSPALSLAS